MSSKTYVVDIDGTICSQVSDGNYDNAVPFRDRITKINELYYLGNRVVLFTARGMGRYRNDPESFLKIEKLTKKQIDTWQVRHDELIFRKPSGDVYIDDKGVNANEFFD